MLVAVGVGATLITTPHAFNSPTSMVLGVTHGLVQTPVEITGRDSARVTRMTHVQTLIVAHHVVVTKVVLVVFITTAVTAMLMGVAAVLTMVGGDVSGNVLAKEMKCCQEKE